MGRLQLIVSLCCWGLIVGGGDWAAAHPFHISTAEMEFDGQTDRLQVSLKLQAVDLEQALAKLAGRRINIEQSQAQKLIIEFLNRSVYLTAPSSSIAQAETSSPALADPERQTSTIVQDAPLTSGLASGPNQERRLRSQVHWVGQELKGAWLWLYFELELPSQRQGLRLFNTVLFETNASQINTVSVRHGAQRTTLKLTSQQPSANFEAKWLTGD